MRVLITSAYWHPHRGGIETVAREHATRLAAKGHGVTVLTSRLAGDAARADDGPVVVHRVAAANPLERRGIPYPLFAPSLGVRVAVQVARHDVVISHSHTYQTSVAAALACKALGKPLVALQHNTFVEYGLPWTLVEHAADATLGRTSLGLATRRLAVSSCSRDYVRAIVPGADAEVLYNGVDTTRFCPVASLPERAALRSRLGIPTDAFVAMTVRRMVAKNGVGDLIAAALTPEVVAQGVHVLLVGAGPDRVQLQQQVDAAGASHVRLVGFVADDALPEYYRAADVFVLPSRSGEGFPMAVLEAFASGLPVVATRAGGQTDVVRDGDTGWLVPPGNPAALAGAMAAAATDRAAAAELGRRARAFVLALDWDHQVQQLIVHLEGAIHDVSR